MAIGGKEVIFNIITPLDYQTVWGKGKCSECGTRVVPSKYIKELNCKMTRCPFCNEFYLSEPGEVIND